MSKFKELVENIYIDDKISDYILSIVLATRNPKEYSVPIEGMLEYGASPRATIALKQAANLLYPTRQSTTPGVAQSPTAFYALAKHA